MNDLNPTRILITAGATQEQIDEVRYLSNRSSGQIGTALAYSAATYGHQVTILHGIHSCTPPTHPRIAAIPYRSTRDLAALASEHWPSHDLLIMTAAVSDYTPVGGQVHGKLQREGTLTMNLAPTEDVVASLAEQARDNQSIIAFALEEQLTLEEAAKRKLQKKGVDAIVANPLGTMESDTIDATVYHKDGREVTPPESCSKTTFATWLIENLDMIFSST